MSQNEYAEAREENLQECGGEIVEEKPVSPKGRSSRLGKEAKVGAAVILLLAAVFVAAVIVRLTQSHSNGKAVAMVDRSAAEDEAAAPSHSDPTTMDRDSRRSACTLKPPPTIVPANAAPIPPPAIFSDSPVASSAANSPIRATKNMGELRSEPIAGIAAADKNPPSDRVASRAAEPPLGLGRADRFTAEPPPMPPELNIRRTTEPPLGLGRTNDSIPAPPPELASPNRRMATAPSLAAPPPAPPENLRYTDKASNTSRQFTSESTSKPRSRLGDDDLRTGATKTRPPESSPKMGRPEQYPTDSEPRVNPPGPYASNAAPHRSSETAAPDFGLKQPTRSASSEPPPAQTTKAGRGTYRPERLYTVKDGDTLFTIARYELGRASRWVEIYDQNRKMFGDDFNNLKPGISLILPDAEDRVAEPPRETRWR